MSICPRCQASFSCCMVEGGDAVCWCSAIIPLALEDMPANVQAGSIATCYCPSCLVWWKNERVKNRLGNDEATFQLP